MATVDSTDSGASPGQAGDSGGPLDLAGKISRTEGELVDVKRKITELEPLVKANHDFQGPGLYSSVDEAKAELKDLKAEKARLDDRLNTFYETQKLTAQQQQSGAGASVSLFHCVIVSWSELVVRTASPTM